jgi:signal peptidase I
MHDAFLRAQTRTAVDTAVRVELCLLFATGVVAAAAAAHRGGMWLVLLAPLGLLLVALAALAATRPPSVWIGTATNAALVSALVLMLVLGILPHTGLYRPVTVLSGSMRPAFAPGDTIFVTPERLRDVRVGQVITYSIPVDDHHVESHRVIRILKRGDDPVVITKGDANRSADPWRAELHGKVIWVERFHVPMLGRLVLWFRSPLFHKLTVFVLPILLAAYGLLRIWRAPSKDGPVNAPESA